MIRIHSRPAIRELSAIELYPFSVSDLLFFYHMVELSDYL
jgi:hypothetical protein